MLESSNLSEEIQQNIHPFHMVKIPENVYEQNLEENKENEKSRFANTKTRKTKQNKT